MKKRFLVTALCLLVLIPLLAVQAFAATVVDSGECGDNITWTLTSDGTLSISGEGDMWDFEGSEGEYGNPWTNYDFLTRIIVGEGVTGISDESFAGCSYVTDIFLPSSVSSIGSWVFEGCVNLAGIWVDSGNASYSNDDRGVLFDKNKTKLLQAPNAISGVYAIPEGVTTVTYGAFRHCHELTHVTIPSSVVISDEQMFSVCYNLVGVWVDEKHPNYSSDEFGVFFNKDKTRLCFAPRGISGTYTVPDGVKEITSDAFFYCTGMTSVAIPNSVSQIGGSAFFHCTGMTSVSIPDSVTTIGARAFNGCSGLTSVTIGSGLSEIRSSAFDNCINLMGFRVSSQNPNYSNDERGVLFNKDKTELVLAPGGLSGAYEIPDSVQDIAEYAFHTCNSLTAVTISENVKGIYRYAFASCDNLTRIVLRGKVSTIANSAFSDVVGSIYFPREHEDWVETIREKIDAYYVEWIPYDPLNITKQPVTTYTRYGETAKVTVKAAGDGLTYQWYYRNADESTYSKSSNQKDTYKPVMNETSKDRRVYCVITDAYGNTVQTKTVVIRMAASVITQPKSIAVENGKTAKVTLKAMGDGLTYKWYYKNAGATKFSLTTSFTSNSYSVAMNEARDGRQVYCVVKDKYGKTVQSNTVTLNMSKPLTITTQPKTTYTQNGATAKVTVKAEGDGLTYQWYIRNASGSTYSKSSITSATYSCKMSSSVKDRRVYCVVKDQYGNTVQTKTVILRMAASITSQPVNASAAKGKTVSVTVGAAGDGLTYKWYIKNASGTKFSVSSVTGATYSCTMSATSNGRQIYCVVTDKYGNTVKSNVVTLSMK